MYRPTQVYLQSSHHSFASFRRAHLNQGLVAVNLTCDGSQDISLGPLLLFGADLSPTWPQEWHPDIAHESMTVTRYHFRPLSLLRGPAIVRASRTGFLRGKQKQNDKKIFYALSGGLGESGDCHAAPAALSVTKS